MKKVKYERVEDSQELLAKGYHLATYDGSFSLEENERTPERVEGEGLSLNGAFFFVEKANKNLERLVDAKVCINSNGNYDVYTLVKEEKK